MLRATVHCVQFAVHTVITAHRSSSQIQDFLITFGASSLNKKLASMKRKRILSVRTLKYTLRISLSLILFAISFFMLPYRHVDAFLLAQDSF